MNYAKKTIICLLFSTCLVTCSVAGTYKTANAAGLESAILGAAGAVGITLTLPQILCIVGLSTGVIITEEYIRTHQTDIDVTINNLCVDYCNGMTHADEIVQEFFKDAKKGIIDTSSACFTALKNFAWDLMHESSSSSSPDAIMQVNPMKVGTVAHTITMAGVPYELSPTKFRSYAGEFPIENVYDVCYYNEDKYYYCYVSSQYSDFDYDIINKLTGNISSSREMLGQAHARFVWDANHTITKQAYVKVYNSVSVDVGPYEYSGKTFTEKEFTDFLRVLLGLSEATVTDVSALPWGPASDVADTYGVGSDAIGVSVGAGEDAGVISVPDVLDKLGVNTVDDIVSGAETGEIEWADFADALPLDMTIDIPNDDIYEFDEIGEISPTPYIPPTNDTSGFTLKGLEKIFPFCIPWDIYDLFNSFCSDPRAPHIDYKFSALGHTYDIDIDLNKFDGVAQILRDCILILFMVGLAYNTRKLIGAE